MNHLDVCAACNQAMLPVEPDQITHPCCDPDDTPLPVVSIEEIIELIGDLGRCQGCGQPFNQPGLIKRCRDRHEAAQR
jgi:hypothetical protein